ncbi:hypothetical protein ACVI1K_004176 [Bradyrhizobium sp. USDA 4508]
MMSVAYDYERDARRAPTIRDELLLIDGARVRSLSGNTFSRSIPPPSR